MPAAVPHALSAPDAVAALPSPAVSPTAPPADATPPLVPLYAYLAQVPDQRHRRGRRHPLVARLAEMICALLCWAPHLQAICDWGPIMIRNSAPNSAIPVTAPCRSPAHYCLAQMRLAALEAQVRAWVPAVEAQLQERDPLLTAEALAVDGKTMCGA